MDSRFIEHHIANEVSIDMDDKLHCVDLSPTDFSNLCIDFYPGFSERNAFLGKFKSTRKRIKKSQYSDQTPIRYSEHKSKSHQTNDTESSTSSLDDTIHALSTIPIGSRLRYINRTNCENMMYSQIMTLLASKLIDAHTNIVLKFEDIKYIPQKVRNSSGAVMAWHVKQQSLGRGVNFSNKHMDCITHSCVRDIVDSWYITLVAFTVIVYDLSILFYTESHLLFWNWHEIDAPIQLQYEENLVLSLTLIALILYTIELVFRTYGYAKHFIQAPIHEGAQINVEHAWYPQGYNNTCWCCGYCTRGWVECVDACVLVFSLLWTISAIIYLHRIKIELLSLPLALPFLYECLRIIRVLFRIIHKLKYIPKCIRLIVRVNRQTYFDDSFDLDLCYIVYPRYLVMSWPSSGFESLYRNPLNHVAQFLNKYHAGRYLIFDLCKERSYDDILFNGRVMRSRAMTDHSVCSLSDMFEFAILVHLWLRHNPIHCAVIHCKGGKGRTGLMVCACLMYDYRDTTVDEALQYFATMRTNTTKSGKLQGVETPSQLRYCKYFYQLLHITDVLKIKQENKHSMEDRDIDPSLSPSFSPNTTKFYKMVTSPHRPLVDSISLSLSPSQEEEDERIMDEDARIKIAKHLGFEDLNISGLKQNKNGRCSIVSTYSVHSPDPPDADTKHKISSVGSESEATPRYKTSDVNISSLKLDQNKLYVRGQWQTHNPIIGTQLLLRQRFTPSALQNVYEDQVMAQVKKARPKQHSASASIFARQRDSTVIAQSLAKSKPQPVPLLCMENEEEEDYNRLRGSLNYMAQEKEGKEEEIEINHMSDDFVSISNESYLCEQFLKQTVVMKLKYVSIGPIVSEEWNNKCIHWKIQICCKQDFDYLDEMKVYDFTRYTIQEQNFHRLKFSVFHNLEDGQTSLALNGNICFKIFRCEKEVAKMIGLIWIHSHFIPANYKQQTEVMRFGKEEIDGMYKDKKHKTSIPQSFCVQIGYRSSRIKSHDKNKLI
eukprot:57978_1